MYKKGQLSRDDFLALRKKVKEKLLAKGHIVETGFSVYYKDKNEYIYKFIF